MVGLKRAAGVVLALACVLSVGFACASAGTQSNQEQAPNSTANPETTTAEVEVFTAENWGTLIADLDGSVGSRVDIVAKVFQIEKAEDSVWVQAYADPKNMEWNTIIGYSNPEFVVAENDYVHAIGTVVDIFEGKNAFGAELRLPRVVADSLRVVDATAVGPKPTRIFGTPLTQDQHGVKVTVTKVEFTPTESRVYVTVRNTTNQKATCYTFNAKATQGTKQFEVEAYGSDYPEVQSELLPGIESSGVVVFQAMDPSKATEIHLEARSEDYSVDFNPYVFVIPAS